MAFEARITAPALIDNQHTMTAELQFPEWLRVEQTDTISVLRFPPSMSLAKPPELPSLQTTEQTRSLPVEILLLIDESYSVYHAFPETIVIQIFEHLDYAGRACLALACKDNARIAAEHGLLKSSKPADELAGAMDEFFFLCDPDLPNIKFCTHCGVYRSRKEDFWRKRASTELDKIGGQTAIEGEGRWSGGVLTY